MKRFRKFGTFTIALVAAVTVLTSMAAAASASSFVLKGTSCTTYGPGNGDDPVKVCRSIKVTDGLYASAYLTIDSMGVAGITRCAYNVELDENGNNVGSNNDTLCNTNTLFKRNGPQVLHQCVGYWYQSFGEFQITWGYSGHTTGGLTRYSQTVEGNDLGSC